jgi:hypothetical protein
MSSRKDHMSTPNRATAAGSERTTLNGLTEKALFDRLNLPFDVEDIKWKPQTVDYRKKTAMAVAHADPRAYIDRLNEVVGIGGWESHLELSNSPFNKFIRGKKAYGSNPATEDKQIPGNKVYCVCSVTIEGIGTHTSTVTPTPPTRTQRLRRKRRRSSARACSLVLAGTSTTCPS